MTRSGKLWSGLQKPLYGDLGDNLRFAASFARWHRLIQRDGTAAALGAYLAG